MITSRVLIPIIQLSRSIIEGLCQKKKKFFIHRATYAIQKLLGFLEFLVRSPTIQRIISNSAVSFNKQLHHLSRHGHSQPPHRWVVCTSEVSGHRGHRTSMAHPQQVRTPAHGVDGKASCASSFSLYLIFSVTVDMQCYLSFRCAAQRLHIYVT